MGKFASEPAGKLVRLWSVGRKKICVPDAHHVDARDIIVFDRDRRVTSLGGTGGSFGSLRCEQQPHGLHIFGFTAGV